MARLAAYYQEDFHYAPIGYGPKKRKSAYIIYEEPRNNLSNNTYRHNGPRLRNLAASDPSLSHYSPKTAAMTLKQSPHVYDPQLTNGCDFPTQNLTHACDSVTAGRHYRYTRQEPDIYETEPLYTYSEKPMRYYNRPSPKAATRKRLSYSEPYDSFHPPEVYDEFHAQNASPVSGSRTYHNEPYFPGSYGIEQREDTYYPPTSYRTDTNHARFLHWPWTSQDVYASPRLLSPPSPLDSGLSSQSITSSPSLEAEPVLFHSGPMQISRPDGYPKCSCPQRMYCEGERLMSPSNRYDSGRSSPGGYSTVSRCTNALPQLNNGVAEAGFKAVSYADPCLDAVNQNRTHVRHGMLGLVGEPVNSGYGLVPVSKPLNRNFGKHEYLINGRPSSSSHDYVDQNIVRLKKSGSHMTKSHKYLPSNTRPCVIITEASEKSTTNAVASEHDNSDKSPEPESSVSVTMSNSASNSSSVTSSNHDLHGEERRKVNKTTEKEIRELEDMYQKCNLNDYDLLDRAERRDLPTAHQTINGKINRNLMRSKSDTVCDYEVMTPSYRNPYERLQRAPPFRRAGMPDKISDDMATRKICKPVTTSSFDPTENTITYMLCSSHFTPTVPSNPDILLMDNPDVEYDDLAYRKHYFGKKGKITDPQPPFGIPLRPPPPQKVFNDYLHAVSSEGLQPLCHPRGNPDVVRDDMAFRTLRKDEPERIYYDISQMYRKKRG